MIDTIVFPLPEVSDMACANLANGVLTPVGSDVGTKRAYFGVFSTRFTLRMMWKKQASGAILITQQREGSFGGV
ncbi:MAG: hypothetical protein NVS4B11_37550 [Ktedonobacteraceae bacterium]